MSNTDKDDNLISDFELAQLVRDLDREKMPERDLWAGIQRSILDHPQKTPGRDQQFWMPYAVAASMLIAVASLMLNLTQDQPVSFQTETAGFDQMQQEYIQVRNPMVEEFNRVNDRLDDKTMTVLHQNLDILAQARADLEQQVRENPDNQRLLDLLLKIHEQELELLRQDYTRPSTTL
jgi:hypothetical protein